MVSQATALPIVPQCWPWINLGLKDNYGKRLYNHICLNNLLFQEILPNSYLINTSNTTLAFPHILKIQFLGRTILLNIFTSIPITSRPTFIIILKAERKYVTNHFHYSQHKPNSLSQQMFSWHELVRQVCVVFSFWKKLSPQSQVLFHSQAQQLGNLSPWDAKGRQSFSSCYKHLHDTCPGNANHEPRLSWQLVLMNKTLNLLQKTKRKSLCQQNYFALHQKTNFQNGKNRWWQKAALKKKKRKRNNLVFKWEGIKPGKSAQLHMLIMQMSTESNTTISSSHCDKLNTQRKLGRLGK